MQVYFTSNEVKLLSEIWHVRCGQRWLGPYSYPELCLMLQNKHITRHQFVRNTEMDGWKKMTELDYFSQKFIESFLTNYSPRQEIERTRSQVRIEVGDTPIVIIKNGEIMQGKCKQLSAGGARIEMPFGKVKLKDDIKIHFPFNTKLMLKSFNVEAQILRCDKLSIVDGKNEAETFSIQFVSLRAKYKKQILKFVQKEVNKICGQMKKIEELETKIDFVQLGIKRSELMKVSSENNRIILVG